MNHHATALWLATGLAIVAVSAAHAAKPTTTPQQRKAMAEHMARNHQAFNATQPKTMAQADATQVRLPSGSVMARVPTELWNELSVQREADGRLRMREADGTAQAVETTEGPAHE